MQLQKETFLKYNVKSESNAMYKKGIEQLKLKGFEIAGFVCDGRRGLINSFKSIPVQMCQFHQAAFVRRYIAKNPRMPAANELKEITSLLEQSDRDSFEGTLNLWYDKWKVFLNERTINEKTGKRTSYIKDLEVPTEALKQTSSGCLPVMIILILECQTQPIPLMDILQI